VNVLVFSVGAAVSLFVLLPAATPLADTCR